MTWGQAAKAAACGAARAAVAQIAGHGAGTAVDIGVQSLPNTMVSRAVGTAFIPLAAGVAGGSLGRRYAGHYYPSDSVRSKMYAGFGFILAGGAALLVLPLTEAGVSLGVVGGTLNSISSSWVNAAVTSLLRGGGMRIKLQYPGRPEGAWAMLAPWVGTTVGAFGAVGGTLLTSRTLLRGVEAAMGGAVIGAMSTAMVAAVAVQCAANRQNPCVYERHRAFITRPDGSWVLRGALSTAFSGAHTMLSTVLRGFMHAAGEAPQIVDACRTLASSVAGNVVSKLLWSFVNDAPSLERRRPHDVEAGQGDHEHAA